MGYSSSTWFLNTCLHTGLSYWLNWLLKPFCWHCPVFSHNAFSTGKYLLTQGLQQPALVSQKPILDFREANTSPENICKRSMWFLVVLFYQDGTCLFFRAVSLTFLLVLAPIFKVLRGIKLWRSSWVCSYLIFLPGRLYSSNLRRINFPKNVLSSAPEPLCTQFLEYSSPILFLNLCAPLLRCQLWTSLWSMRSPLYMIPCVHPFPL